MPRLLALLLPLAVLACAQPTMQATSPPSLQPASPPPGAVHYQLRNGTQLLSCITWGYDTVCRSG